MAIPSPRPPHAEGGSGRKRASALGSRKGRTDEQLLALYRDSHSAEAFCQLVARHRPLVFRCCHRVLPNVQDAEDAVQAVFLQLIQRPELVKKNLAAWLPEVARGVSIDLLRARSRRTDREKSWAAVKQGDTPLPDRDMLEELSTALTRLPTRLRRAVQLRYIEGRSVEESAQLAGCPSGTLGRRAMEGLKKLRSILVRRGSVSPPPDRAR